MIRFSSAISKCFISFVPMFKLDAAFIIDCILNTMETLGLDYKSSLIGFGFDGASDIRSHWAVFKKASTIKHNLLITCTVMDYKKITSYPLDGCVPGCRKGQGYGEKAGRKTLEQVTSARPVIPFNLLTLKLIHKLSIRQWCSMKIKTRLKFVPLPLRKNLRPPSAPTHFQIFKIATDSTETTRPLYSCISYFRDNDITGTEESSELFFFFLFILWQRIVVAD